MTQTLDESLQPEYEHECKYCGMPSQVDPSDQTAPPDYCHEADHMLYGAIC